MKVVKILGFSLFLSLFSLSFSTNTLGGDWSSGGGNLFTTEKNPWFVQNTRDVSYCLKIDEENFGIDYEKGKTLIAKAFSYWKEQFADNSSFAVSNRKNGVNPLLKIGTQEFHERTCGPEVDIIFQFGYLTENQKTFLKKPRKVVGAAVRTNYDPVNLKGKGFVYISPERGPLSLIHNENHQPSRWTHENGKILLFVLIHEIGHIFGIQHGGGFMAESYPEEVILKDFSPEGSNRLPDFYFLQKSALRYKFIPQRRPEFFGITRKISRVLGIKEKFWSIKGEWSEQTNKLIFNYQEHMNDAPIKIGEMKFKMQDFNFNNKIYLKEQAVKVFLPAKQNVFPEYRGKEDIYLLSLGLTEIKYQGEFYNLILKKKQSFQIELDGLGMSVSGVDREGELALKFLNLANYNYSFKNQN